MGVAGGLENVEEREEKSRTGEDIVTDPLEGSRRNRAGMEGGEDAKTPPKGRVLHFATVERAVQIKLLISKKPLKIVCIERETCQTHQSKARISHGFCMPRIVRRNPY